MKRTKKLIETIGLLIEGGFSGYIKINFTQGSLGRVEKYEELDDASSVLKGSYNDTKGDGRIYKIVDNTDAKAMGLLVMGLAGCAALILSLAACRYSQRKRHTITLPG